ncbi:MAG: SDR family oxidoreductase, partial [Burkholderiales bacterium]
QTRAAIAHKGLTRTGKTARDSIVKLRLAISRAADAPMILETHDDAHSLGFARRDDIALISQKGPATPDHVIRTKRVPMLGTDVASYVEEYRKYFEMHVQAEKTMLDPAPRIVLDPEIGMIAAGKTAKDASIAAEIYQHTMDIIERASRLSRYEPLSAGDLFEVEYWDLEQAKLKKSGTPPLFTGEIALVTGAASGIGKACVEALLSMGAAAAGFDINPEIETSSVRSDFLGITGDVTSESDIVRALDLTVKAFGGLDMLVLNAGIFPVTREIADLTTDEWRKVFAINLDANLVLMRQCLPLLKAAPKGGRVVIIASKNVPAPGPGAAAYSASKAALNQLARVAALEWGKDGIRVNIVHPNAVFDTGVWNEEVLRSRAQSYGLSVDAYKKNNVLATEVSSRDVAEMVVTMCGPAFAKTTGAQVPVDGGNDRVI